MCSLGEFYNMAIEKCQKCTVCPKGDSLIFKCSSFLDTVCESELWKDIPKPPPNPVPTTSHATRGPETVEVLTEDLMSSPTILIVISAVFLTTILVTLIVAVYCLWGRLWRYKQEKRIQYLPRRKSPFLILTISLFTQYFMTVDININLFLCIRNTFNESIVCPR